MKSICIKTNNSKSIKYLLEKINDIKLDNVYFSCKKFKIYENIIIHFKGKNEKKFIEIISKILTNFVIENLEKNMINKIISYEYFYFDSEEKKEIANKAIEDLENGDEAIYPKEGKLKLLYIDFYQYLICNKSIVLQGFLTFRTRNYIEILEEQVDKAVSTFLIEKEYNEFIALLRIYINTEKNNCDIIHLVYYNSKAVLLDEDKKIIKIDKNVFNAKFLSDISFSSSDYALNTLLTLLPKKIYVHLIDNTVDEFISTLKQIFENRIIYCNDCSICHLYKNGANFSS